MKLDVLSDFSERIPYNITDFPLHAGIVEMKNFHRYSTACHWHLDLEFCLPIKGNMDVFVNGETFHVAEGHGIFINSKRLHYNYSLALSDCTYLCITINPFAFNDAAKVYMDEKFNSSNEDSIHLSKQVNWQDELMQELHKIYDEMHEANRNILYILSLAFKVCSAIWQHIKPTGKKQPDGEHWLIIWKMTRFVHTHFESKISLDDIAVAGSVCRTKCCELFSEYLNKTPGAYLTDYRIQKSCEMLRNTSCSISEIALSCGFQSASYYSYVFRRETGLTPKGYRKK